MHKLLLIVALVGSFGIAAVVYGAGASSVPPPPPNPEDFPAFIEAAGPDGGPIICPNGEPLRIPRSELLGPPPAPSVAVGPRTTTGERLPRCSPDSQLVWVPAP